MVKKKDAEAPEAPAEATSAPAPAETPEGKSKKDAITKLLEGPILGALKKQYGDNVVFRANESLIRRPPRIPTGIFPLDLTLGGGFTTGAFHALWGHKSSGKTTVLLRTIGQAQKRCGVCWGRPGFTCTCKKSKPVLAGFLDPEGTLDLDWAVKQGVDVTRLLVTRPESGEQALNVLEALLRSEEVHILGLDSIAFLVPEKEIQEGVEKVTMGEQARLVSKAMRKLRMALNALMNENKLPTILMTNQVRMKIGVMFGNPETQPGGLAPGFAMMTEVRMGSQKYELEPKTSRPLYVDINFHVDKNKSATPKRKADFRLILADTETKKLGDVYDENSMMDEAEGCGLIEHQGPTWIYLGEKYESRSKIERRLLLDPEFKVTFREALLRVLMPLGDE